VQDAPENLRKLSLLFCLVGIVGSVGLFLFVSRQTPFLIIVLFVGWLSAPSVLSLLAHRFSRRWQAETQRTFYLTNIVVTFISLAIFLYQVIWPRPSTPAFYWVAVPPASVTLLILIVATVALMSRRSIQSAKN